MKNSRPHQSKIPAKKEPKVLMDEFYDEFEFETSFFTQLIEARKDQGLSQRDLAKKIGIDQAALARFESGDTNPTLTFIKKVMIGLGLEIKVVKSDSGRLSL